MYIQTYLAIWFNKTFILCSIENIHLGSAMRMTCLRYSILMPNFSTGMRIFQYYS